MKTVITPIVSTEQREHSFVITALSPYFTDWRGGESGPIEQENQPDEEFLKRLTLELGNQTDLDLHPDDSYVRLPSQSVVIAEKNFYERLRAHNRDTFWQYRVDVGTSTNLDNAFKRHLIDALGSQVGLNPLQKHHAYKRFMKLDLRRVRGRSEANAFIVCSLVVNSDAEACGRDKVYHPQRSPDNNDCEFQRVAENLMDCFPKVTESALTSIYNKLAFGEPPLRPRSKWQSLIRHEPFVPLRPSYASDRFDPDELRDDWVQVGPPT